MSSVSIGGSLNVTSTLSLLKEEIILVKRRLFTSESVTEGHPDKICDQISDAILDAFLTKDPKARVAAETSVTTVLVLVSGEITSTCYVDIASVVRRTIQEIGYVGEAAGGFDG